MGVIQLWSEGREAMSALGHTLVADQVELPVPACPAWTVRQVYAHQTGVTVDVLAGRMDDAPSDAWTGRQVDERADRSLVEILDEWDQTAPQLVAVLDRPDDDGIDPRFVMDLWHHTQDVRTALGLPGEASGALTEWVIDRSQFFLGRMLDRPGLEIALGVLPAEPTPGVLTVPGFELARAMLGRRSDDQIRAWSWGVDDPDEIEVLAARVPVFTARPDPLVEAMA